jgi:hypothetical protein
MTEQVTLETLARQMEHLLNESHGLKGQLMELKGMLMQTEARAQGLLAEMREWRLSQPDDDEPTRDH